MILLEHIITKMVMYSLALEYMKQYVLLNSGIALKNPTLNNIALQSK